MILKRALGGLDVAGELVDELVGESILHSGGIALVFRPDLKAACGPLVPTRDEDHAGVNLQGVLPLLGEVVAPLGGLCALHIETVLVIGGVGTTRDVITAHSGQQMMDIVVVLSDTDGNLLYITTFLLFLILIMEGLGIHRQPAPAGIVGFVNKIGGFTCAEGEVTGDLLVGQGGDRVKAILHGHEHGLLIPVEPGLGPLVLTEDIQIQHLHLGASGRLIPKGEHEGNLRSLDTILHGIRPRAHEGGIAIAPSMGAVGVVGEDHVHTRVGKQFTLSSLYPTVVSAVVAVDRLIPEGNDVPQLCPQGVVIVPHGLGVLGGELLHIDRLVPGGAADVPGPVEHGQGLILAGIANLLVGQGHASQTVGEHPGIGHNLVGVDQAIRRNDIGSGGLVFPVGEVSATHAGGEIIVSLGSKMQTDIGHQGRGFIVNAIGIDLALKARCAGIGV